MPGQVRRSVVSAFGQALLQLPTVRYFAWAGLAVVIGILLLSDARAPLAVRHLAEVVALLLAFYALERLAHSPSIPTN